jgi:hypothetical protein
MPHKQVLFRSVAREKLLRGAAQLADAVRVTLGPKSKSVLLQRTWGAPLVCNDGVTIAKEFDLKDAEENLGAQMLRQAASPNHRSRSFDKQAFSCPSLPPLRRGFLQSLDGAHLIQLVKQIEGQRYAWQVQAEIPLQALCFGDAHDAQRRELPARSRLANRLDHAVLYQSRNPIGVDIAGEAQIVEAAHRPLVDDLGRDAG